MAATTTPKKKTREQVAAEQKAAPTGLSLKDFPQAELEALLEKATERAVKTFLHKKAGEFLDDEWRQAAVTNINAVSRKIIGKSYWNVVEIAKNMQRGNIAGFAQVGETMTTLAGYYSSISTAASVMEAQYREEFARNFLEAKRSGYTDGTATQAATYACAEIQYRRMMFNALRDSTIELINVCKKSFDAAKEEKMQVTPYQQG